MPGLAPAQLTRSSVPRKKVGTSSSKILDDIPWDLQRASCGAWFRQTRRDYATPGVLLWAFCGKSNVSTSGSAPVFSISTPPLLSAAWVMKPISG